MFKTVRKRAIAGPVRALDSPEAPSDTEKKRPSADAGLIKAMQRIAWRVTRAGYRSVARHLRRDGWQVNIKRIHRLWKLEILKVPAKAGKKRRLSNSA